MASNHPFERAGLGIAPFRFVGYFENTFQACPSAPIQPGGTCDYCGQGIRHCFKIRSSDGREFKVGCDCVEKTCQPGGPIVTAVQKAAKKAKKASAAAQLIDRIGAARAKLDANPDMFADRPHPNAYLTANRGLTLRDSILFLLERGGAAGQTKGCKAVERAA